MIYSETVLAQSDRAAVAAITAELDTLHLDGGGGVSDALAELHRLLGTETTCLFGIAETATGLALARFESVSAPPRLRARFERFISGAPPRYGMFDATRPEPDQRNRVIESTMLGSADKHEIKPILEHVLRPSGLGDARQLRTLLCEGASLLAWLGTLQSEPFSTRQRALIAAVARPIRRRLLVERRIDRERLALAAVEATLDAIGSPALLIGRQGRVCEANAGARRLLATRGRELRAALADALARRPTATRVQLVALRDRGLGPHWLAVLHVDEAEARVAAVATRWRLTPRETEVLGWIARGATNQRIAAELGCAARTVELHVTHVLTKADASSRTELVARLLA